MKILENYKSLTILLLGRSNLPRFPYLTNSKSELNYQKLYNLFLRRDCYCDNCKKKFKNYYKLI